MYRVALFQTLEHTTLILIEDEIESFGNLNDPTELAKEACCLNLAGTGDTNCLSIIVKQGNGDSEIISLM